MVKHMSWPLAVVFLASCSAENGSRGGHDTALTSLSPSSAPAVAVLPPAVAAPAPVVDEVIFHKVLEQNGALDVVFDVPYSDAEYLDVHLAWDSCDNPAWLVISGGTDGKSYVACNTAEQVIRKRATGGTLSFFLAADYFGTRFPTYITVHRIVLSAEIQPRMFAIGYPVGDKNGNLGFDYEAMSPGSATDLQAILRQSGLPNAQVVERLGGSTDLGAKTSASFDVLYTAPPTNVALQVVKGPTRALQPVDPRCLPTLETPGDEIPTGAAVLYRYKRIFDNEGLRCDATEYDLVAFISPRS